MVLAGFFAAVRFLAAVGFPGAAGFFAAAPAFVDSLVAAFFFAADLALALCVVEGFFFDDVGPIGMFIGIFDESAGCCGFWAYAGDPAKRAYKISAAATLHA